MKCHQHFRLIPRASISVNFRAFFPAIKLTLTDYYLTFLSSAFDSIVHFHILQHPAKFARNLFFPLNQIYQGERSYCFSFLETCTDVCERHLSRLTCTQKRWSELKKKGNERLCRQPIKTSICFVVRASYIKMKCIY